MGYTINPENPTPAFNFLCGTGICSCSLVFSRTFFQPCQNVRSIFCHMLSHAHFFFFLGAQVISHASSTQTAAVRYDKLISWSVLLLLWVSFFLSCWWFEAYVVIINFFWLHKKVCCLGMFWTREKDLQTVRKQKKTQNLTWLSVIVNSLFKKTLYFWRERREICVEKAN